MPTDAPNHTYHFSRNYQIKLLALCVRRRDFLPGHRDIVAPEWFDDPVHKDVAKAVLALFDQYGTAPTWDSLFEEIVQAIRESPRLAERAEMYQATVDEMQAAGLDDAEDLTARAAAFARNQAMEQALHDAAGLLGRGQVDEIIRVVERAGHVGHNRADMGTDHFTSTDRWHNQRNQTVVPTGLIGLDACIRGIGKTELGVIEAPPNKGKTLTLVNIGRGALRAGKSVVHITLENQANSVGRRYDGCILGAEMARLLYPESGDVPELASLTRAQRELAAFRDAHQASLIYKFYAPGTATETMIKAYINTLINTGQLDVERGFIIIVDYGMNMRPERQRESRRLEIQECYQGLLRIADYFQCGVWTAMQTNRLSLKKKIIGMEDLAECFAVAADAHMIVSLNPTDEEVDGYPAVDLFVARSRETRGQSIIRMGVDFESTRFVGQGTVMSYADYMRQYDGTSRTVRRASNEDEIATAALEGLRNRRRNPSWRNNAEEN